MSKPMLKVGCYCLIMLGITLAFRLANHRRPSPVVFGVAVPAAYSVWRKERDLDERIRRGKYGARHFQA